MDKKRLVITGLGFFSYQGFEKDTLWEEIEASTLEASISSQRD